MGPQVRFVGVGTGLHGRGLPPGPQDQVPAGENDKRAGDLLETTALPWE